MFWIGLMEGMAAKYDDITQHINFEDVRDNFVKAAKYGIDSTFSWIDDRKVSIGTLVKDELIPIAEQGLKLHGIDRADIDKYINIIYGRAASHMNGARWNLRAYTNLIKETTRDEALTVLTSAIHENQRNELPGHLWGLPQISDLMHYRPNRLLVEEFMRTDIFTVQEDDIIEFVSDLMKWRKIRHIPVEDDEGKLVGLMTTNQVIEYHRNEKADKEKMTVRDLMIKDPITIAPMETIKSATKLMRDKSIGCLPVVNNGELAGIITEQDVLRISSRMIER